MREVFRNIQDLPAEILHLVFRKLRYEDLMCVVRVCKEWKTLGESPTLWREFRLMVKPKNFGKLDDVLMLHRFDLIRSLFLNGGAQRLDNDSLEIIKSSKISKITLKDCSLTETCPYLIAKCFCQMEIVNLVCTHMDKSQVREVMNHISKHVTPMKELRFDSILSNAFGYGSFVDLSEVPSDIVSSALNKIEHLELGRTELTTEQLTKFFEDMAVETRVQNFTLTGNVISQVCPKILSQGLSKLVNLTLNHTKLTTDQVEKILECILEDSNKIRNLDLSMNQVSGVRSELESLADKKLESFYRDSDYDDDYDFEYYDGYALEDDFFDYIGTDD